MKFYVINLKRSPKRWAHIQQQFAQFGLIATRVEAVDGRKLTKHDLSLYRTGRYATLADDEIACFLSHRTCWQQVADGDDPYACIFEDDVHISKHFPDFLQTKIWTECSGLLSIEQFHPVIRAKPRPVVKKSNYCVYRCVESNPGAAGYILSKTIAKQLLQDSDPFYHLVDSFLFSPRRIIAARFNSYQLAPAVCLQGRKNKEFSANHYVHPTSIGSKRHLSIGAARANRGFKYILERLWIYWRFYAGLIHYKKIPIEFEE